MSSAAYTVAAQSGFVCVCLHVSYAEGDQILASDIKSFCMAGFTVYRTNRVQPAQADGRWKVSPSKTTAKKRGPSNMLFHLSVHLS
jgi:hypothetical protein